MTTGSAAFLSPGKNIWKEETSQFQRLLNLGLPEQEYRKGFGL